jgi:hypothetical protein
VAAAARQIQIDAVVDQLYGAGAFLETASNLQARIGRYIQHIVTPRINIRQWRRTCKEKNLAALVESKTLLRCLGFIPDSSLYLWLQEEGRFIVVGPKPGASDNSVYFHILGEDPPGRITSIQSIWLADDKQKRRLRVTQEGRGCPGFVGLSSALSVQDRQDPIVLMGDPLMAAALIATHQRSGGLPVQIIGEQIGRHRTRRWDRLAIYGLDRPTFWIPVYDTGVVRAAKKTNGYIRIAEKGLETARPGFGWSADSFIRNIRSWRQPWQLVVERHLQTLPSTSVDLEANALEIEKQDLPEELSASCPILQSQIDKIRSEIKTAVIEESTYESRNDRWFRQGVEVSNVTLNIDDIIYIRGEKPYFAGRLRHNGETRAVRAPLYALDRGVASLRRLWCDLTGQLPPALPTRMPAHHVIDVAQAFSRIQTKSAGPITGWDSQQNGWAFNWFLITETGHVVRNSGFAGDGRTRETPAGFLCRAESPTPQQLRPLAEDPGQAMTWAVAACILRTLLYNRTNRQDIAIGIGDRDSSPRLYEIASDLGWRGSKKTTWPRLPAHKFDNLALPIGNGVDAIVANGTYERPGDVGLQIIAPFLRWRSEHWRNTDAYDQPHVVRVLRLLRLWLQDYKLPKTVIDRAGDLIIPSFRKSQQQAGRWILCSGEPQQVHNEWHIDPNDLPISPPGWLKASLFDECPGGFRVHNNRWVFTGDWLKENNRWPYASAWFQQQKRDEHVEHDERHVLTGRQQTSALP